MSSPRISEELERLFSDTAYPGDEALAHPPRIEPEPALKKLYGKDWRDVATEGFESTEEVIEVMQALSSKGLLYFLPSLVHLAQTQEDLRAVIVSVLLAVFTHSDGETQPIEPKQEILASLSPRQRGFFVRFFIGVEEADPSLCPILVDSAIDNFKTGKIGVYRQQQVKAWASRKGQPAQAKDQDETLDEDGASSDREDWDPNPMSAPASAKRPLQTTGIFVLALVLLSIGGSFLSDFASATMPVLRPDGTPVLGAGGQPLLRRDMAEYCRDNLWALAAMGLGACFLCWWLARVARVVYARTRGLRE